MSILNKAYGTFTVPTPGPGEPGYPGSPAIPAYYSYYCVTVCNYVWYPPDTDTAVPPMGGGYDDRSGGFWNWECLPTNCVETYHPYQPEVPSVPWDGLSEANRVLYLNIGWNSSSSSIGFLDKEEYLEYYLYSGIRGAFFCIGPRDKDNQLPSNYTHTIFADGSGVHVYERNILGNQVLKATLSNQQNSLQKLIISRSSSGLISYLLKGSSESKSYKSLTSPGHQALPLVVYAKFYQAGDKSFDHDIVSFAGGNDLVVEASVTLAGAGSLLDWAGILNGSGTLTTRDAYAQVTLAGAGDMVGLGSAGDGSRSNFHKLVAIGREIDDPTWGSTPPNTPEFKPLYQYSAYGGQQTPAAQAEQPYGLMTALTGVGTIITTNQMQGDADFIKLESLGGDFLYGVAGSPEFHSQQEIGPMYSRGIYMFPVAVMIDVAYAVPEITPVTSTIIIITDSGTVTDTITGSAIQIRNIVDSLEASDSYTVLGDFSFNMVDIANAISRSGQTISGFPELDSSGQVWVVNLNNEASSQYEGYGFNSFIKRADGYYYGLADDGWYKLNGDKDTGNDISALVDLGRSNYGTPKAKQIKNLYAGVASGGKLLLKVVVDNGTEYVYEMRSSSTKMDNHRFDIGKGLEGNYWHPKLVNQNGDDFDLSDVHFEVIPKSTRKI